MTKWHYVVLGIRLSGKVKQNTSKSRLPEVLKRASATPSMLERFFLESGWDHNFVAEKLPEYNPVTDVHCTFAHTPEYKKQHDQILALEELDRKRLRNTFPWSKVFFRDNNKGNGIKRFETQSCQCSNSIRITTKRYSCIEGQKARWQEREK